MNVQKVYKDTGFYHIFRVNIRPEYGKVIRTNEFRTIEYRNPLRVKREQIAENFRAEFFPNYPSRLKSFYVCTKESIPFWLKKLGTDRFTIVKLELSGKIFWVDSLYYDSEEPDKYWKGCLPHLISSEGLFEGEFISLEDCTEQILKEFSGIF